MEAIYEFIWKVTTTNAAVREWFYNNQPAWQCLITWLGENSRAPHYSQATSKGVTLFKHRQTAQRAALLALNDQGAHFRSSITAAYRLKRMQELIAKQLPDLSQEPDIDRMDLQDFKFIPGDTVYLYSRKLDEATQWKVLAVMDELISLQCTEPEHPLKGQVKWRRTDTDKMLLGNTYNQLARTQARNQLIVERQRARAEQQAQQ